MFQAVQSGSVVSQPGLLTKSQQHSVFGFPVQSLSVKMSQQQLVSSFKHALSIVGGMGIIAVKKEIKILRNLEIRAGVVYPVQVELFESEINKN